MRPWSLRGWLLAVSVLFAVLVVGGIALTTYVIVSDGMQVVALDTTDRVANGGLAVVREAVAEAELRSLHKGLRGSERDAAALATLVDTLPQLLVGSGLSGAQFALYQDPDQPIWKSSDDAAGDAQADVRAEVLETGRRQRSVVGGSSLPVGLFKQAQLRASVVHMPVRLPGGTLGVLDVTYQPRTEERVIDAIRVPMAILAVSAMLIMVVLMQTSMVWVLNLVDDLRKAADSIDAGRLDERLPDTAENEIGELARSINNLIERLERRALAQSRFVADASHELATPVAGIRGYTSILRAWGAGDARVRNEAVDAIDRESKRMARLTSDLLNLLHADQGLVLKTEKFDVNAKVRERLAAIASKYIDKDLEFEGPEDESLQMVGDPDRVEDVLSILLDNAGKYTPEGGMVAARTTRSHEHIIIRVSDSGQGIPPEDQPRIFDRFYRTDVARTEGEGGFGLGLAIAKSIVDSMGGTIAVESALGEGTTFTVDLPRGRM